MSAQSKLNRVSCKLVVQFALVLFVVFCVVQGSLAGIFSYRDDKGAIHFTDDISKIPKQYRDSEQGVRKHRASRGAYRATPQPSAAIELPGSVSSNGEVQVPLIPVGGGNFLIETVLNDRVKARLMLDTGASLITLTEEIGNKLGISPYSNSAELPFNTAGGEDWMPLVALEMVAVCSAETWLVKRRSTAILKKLTDYWE